MSNNTTDEIKKTIKQINQNSKTIISITDFNKKLNTKSLKKINKYKKIFNLRVGYGNHSEIQNISRALKYRPDLLLVYVKLNDKVNFRYYTCYKLEIN